MSIDLGAPVLDVAFALSFVFFLLSIVSSAITEAVAWLSKQRARKLEAGVRGLLGAAEGKDEADVASKVLAHPLVKSDVTAKKGRKRPSYVSPRNFALALTESLKEVGASVGVGVKYGTEAVTQIENSFAKLDPELKQQLEPLWHEVEGDVADFRKSVEGWFDDAMDRVSGWYKRWSLIITIAVAVVLAAGLNASALRITDRLFSDETVRTAVVAGAEGTAATGDSSPEATGAAADEALGELEALKLPIFWAADNSPFESLQTFGESALGWLITAIAISLGAPFWFETLSKLAPLRATGKKPDPAPAPGSV